MILVVLVHAGEERIQVLYVVPSGFAGLGHNVKNHTGVCVGGKVLVPFFLHESAAASAAAASSTAPSFLHPTRKGLIGRLEVLGHGAASQ